MKCGLSSDQALCRCSCYVCAKVEAVLLDAWCCPVDVIRQFSNRSWRFMSAYQWGLTGKVAEWAVCQQKSHWWIGQQAMMVIKSIVNPV